MSEVLIRGRGLVKRFGDRPVVDHLDLTVHAGEIYALLGGNGAGKTTTLYLLLGLIPPEEGEIEVGGVPVRPGSRARAAFVPEVVDLYPDLDPLETLELFAAVAGVSASLADRSGALLAAGLDPAHHRRRLRVLSKGMRQKVALAAAQVQGARAVFLDEPTSGLDPTAADQLSAQLLALRAGGAAVLMSSHDVLQVEAVADRVGIMRQGKLVAERSPRELGVGKLLELYLELNRAV